MKIGRKAPIDRSVLMDELAAGSALKTIAANTGSSYGCMRTRLSRHLQENGFKTAEQAVAHHVAEKIKTRLPLAFHSIVDQVVKKK